MKCSSNIRFRMVESDTAGMQTCPCDSTCTEGNPSSAWRHKAKYPQGVSQKKLAQPGRSAQFTWQRNQCWQWADDFQWEENYGRLISTADGPFTLLLNFSVVYSWSFNCFSWCFDFLAVKQLRMVFWCSLHAHNNHTKVHVWIETLMVRLEFLELNYFIYRKIGKKWRGHQYSSIIAY